MCEICARQCEPLLTFCCGEHLRRAPTEADRLWMRRMAEEKRAAATAAAPSSSSSSSGLQDGGLAWLRTGEASLAVRLLQVRGVPGLDKIRLACCSLARSLTCFDARVWPGSASCLLGRRELCLAGTWSR